MKFTAMNIPTVVGIDIMDSMKDSQTNLKLAKKEIGIPCIIANGRVCNVRGIPYINDVFQNEYKEFAARAQKIKAVIIGTILPAKDRALYDDIYDFGYASTINRNVSFQREEKTRCRIVAEDIFLLLGQEIKAKTRDIMLSSMVKGYNLEFKDSRLSYQEEISMPVFERAKVIDYILQNAKEGCNTKIYSDESIYKQGSETLSECKSFVVDPLEIFNLKIERIETYTRKNYISSEDVEGIKEIVVNYDGNEIKIPYINKKPICEKTLLEGYRNGLIRKVLFRGTPIDGSIANYTIL